jgi:hypothetical protein
MHHVLSSAACRMIVARAGLAVFVVHRGVRAGRFPADWAGDSETSGDFGERHDRAAVGSDRRITRNRAAPRANPLAPTRPTGPACKISLCA